MELPTPEDLRERRKDRLGLTQADLAERADVSQPLIARIEGGDVDPRLSTLRRIVEALEEAEGGVVRAVDIMNEEVETVRRGEDSVETARKTMDEAGYSQLPVVRDGFPTGIISLSDIVQLGEDVDHSALPVAEAMRGSLATVSPDATLDSIQNHLTHHDAVLVVDDGEMVGIITEADVARALG
jgi:predicted transcriptional regulator